MRYWDTSAVVKLYVTEADSETFLELLATPGGRIVTSTVTRIELVSTLHRKQASGEINRDALVRLSGRFKNDIEEGRIETIACGQQVIGDAIDILSRIFAQRRPPLLRTLDALQIASARIAGAADIVTADKRLAAVARLVGLRTLP